MSFFNKKKTKNKIKYTEKHFKKALTKSNK